MHDPFDPYQQWLGIPPAEQPPHHYRLLGLRPCEADHRAITRAVQTRIAHLRKCDDGSHKDDLHRLLQQVTEARHTLLNAKLKEQYDAKLRDEGVDPDQAPAPAPLPVPGAAVAASEPAHPGVAINTGRPSAGVRGRSAARRGPASSAAKNPHLPIILTASGAGVVLLIVLVMALSQSGKSGREGGNRAARQERGQPARSARRYSSVPDLPELSSGRTRWDNVPGARNHGTLADLMNEEEDETPPDTSTLTGTLAAARRAMADRKPGQARKHIQAAASMARSKTERAEADRVAKLLAAWEPFWTPARDAFGRLKSGQEVIVADTRVAIVSAEDRMVVVRAAGKNRIYTIDDMPWKLAVALAEPKLPDDPAQRNLHVGAFLAVDGYGDRDEARRLLGQAGPQGKSLLPEVNLAPRIKKREPQPDRPYAGPMTPAGPGPGAAAGGGHGPKPEGPSQPGKLPVPDVQTQLKADDRVRSMFEADFRDARDAEGKAALVRKLLDTAAKTGNDPVAQFVMLRIAREVAVEVGDPQLIARVIDRTAEGYLVDALDLKAEAIAVAWRSEDAVAHRPALYEQSLSVLESAMAAEHYTAADRVMSVATAGAKAAKNYALVRRLEDQERTIRANLRAAGG